MIIVKKTEKEILENLDTIDTYQKLIGVYYTNENLFEHDYKKDFNDINTTHDINEIIESMRITLSM